MADPATDEALRRFRLIRLFLEIDMPLRIPAPLDGALPSPGGLLPGGANGTQATYIPTTEEQGS